MSFEVVTTDFVANWERQSDSRKIKILEAMVPRQLQNARTECRFLARYYCFLKERGGWELVSPSFEAYCEQYLGKSTDFIEKMLKALEVIPDATIAQAEEIASQAEFRKAVAKEIETVKPLAPKRGNPSAKTANLEGRNQYTNKDEDNSYYNKNCPKTNKGGDSVEYLAAKVSKDAPEIHQKMKQGEYPSVRAAAVDAGIVKPRIQVTWKADATPEQIAQAVLKKIPPELIGKVAKAMKSKA